MKDIGEKLRIKREENGLSVDEVANDLKLRPNQISNIEEGNKDDFKDVTEIKNIIEEYSKYLGIDGETLIDEFNEYMFDCTSKISLSAIQEAMEADNVEKKVSSPYTTKSSNKKFYMFIGICMFIVILEFVICLIVK